MQKISCKYILLVIMWILAWFPLSAQEPGMISISSKPNGATVILNGNDTGRATPFQKALSPGKYSFILKFEGFKDYTGEFELKDYEIKALNFELLPLYSIVQVNSIPDGAQVKLDGKSEGITPLTLKNVPAGDHKIQLSKTSYEDLETSFNNEDGKYIELNKELNSTMGTIGIMAYPDAEIFIDGIRVGKKIFAGNVIEGAHSIKTTMEGYVTEVKEIIIKKNEDLNVRFELQKIKCNVMVNSDPDSANVYIGDKLAGVTPLQIDYLDFGNYEIRIEKDDFEPFYSSINIENGNLIPINSKLKWGETVKINSNPDGAKVFINGTEKGITPYDILLKKGNYSIKLTKFGYEDYLSEVKVSKADILECKLIQKRLAFNIETTPEKAKVFSNDKFIGKTPLKSNLTFGKTNIRITKKGYKEITEEFLLESQPLDLRYKLEFDKVRKKGQAVIYSALFPGAGQAYLARNGTPYLMGVATLGCVGGYLYFDQKATQNYDLYKKETSNAETRSNLFEDASNQHELSNNFIMGAAGIYALNIIWVILMPDDIKKMSKINLSSHLNNNHSSAEIGLTINF